jgi:hypothetical protein
MDETISEARNYKARWLFTSFYLVLGIACLVMLSATLRREYFDYIFFPKVKAVDGYILPPLRVRIYDVLDLVWLSTGIIASATALRCIFLKRSISVVTRRATLLFFLVFVLLLFYSLWISDI